MKGAEILLVDDDPVVIAGLAHSLADLGRLRFATSGQEALALLHQSVPDLVLLDIGLPDLSGFEVIKRMQSDPLLAEVPTLFLTSHDNPDDEIRGLDLGAVDFIRKPPRAPLVRARVQTQLRLKQATDWLRQAADTDGLTGVANRRRFDQALQQEWQRAQRERSPLALVLIDIDHFKRYNDQFGHPAGDACLRAVAQALREVCRRPGDLLARYGGEEFAVLLPHTGPDGAATLASRLMEAVDALALDHAPDLGRVSISLGVAATQALESSPEALLQAADTALYEAKRSGRHRFCLAQPAA